MMPNITNLRQETWARIKSLEEKETALQTLENHLAYEEGRTACRVNVVPMKEFERGSYGRDAVRRGTIEINRNLVDSDLPYQAVETLYHEDDHAHQYHVTQHPELAESEEQLRDWQMSEEGGYIQPEELNLSTYRFQPTEADANRTARERTDEFYQDTFQDQSHYPAYKAQKEQEIADAEELAEFELGENYEEEARQAMTAKHQAMMTMNQNEAIESAIENQAAIGKLIEHSDIIQGEHYPSVNSFHTEEEMEATEKVNRELAEENAEMDAKLAEFYEEGDKKSAEDKPIKEATQQTDTPATTSSAREEDEEQSQDKDYYSGYSM